MTDQLIGKLASMDARRELRARRLSLREALELLVDLPEAQGGPEARRWLEFVTEAHDRGDFRWLHELTRKEWSATRHGRQTEVWSLLDIEAASARLQLHDGATWAPSVNPDPMRDVVFSEIKRANVEGRVFHGGTGVAYRIPFRSEVDPTRPETPQEIEAEVDRKLARFANIADINEAIDVTLERAAARTSSGEAVIPTGSLLGLLESAINAIASVRHGEIFPHRFTDGSFPRWGELLSTYRDVFGKVGSGTNRADEITRRLAAGWNQDDQQARALAEKVVGSPEPLPVELVAVARSAMIA